MKRVHGFWPLVLALTLFCLASAVCAAPGGTGDGPGAESIQPSLAARARQLAADVREFAGSSMISRAKKEKRISTAVRVAVVAATAYRHNPDEILGAAMELAAAAARAAPAYAEAIANAAGFAPGVSRIEGAMGQIRTAASPAARGGRARAARRAPALEAAEATPGPAGLESDARETAANSRRGAEDATSAPEPAPRRHSRARVAATDSAGDTGAAEGTVRQIGSRSLPGDSLGFHVTADIGVRHDDNVFLASANKVGDTIISVTPGVGIQWGQSSLVHGSLGYKEAFNRYTGKTAPNVSLGSGSGNFGYDDGSIAANLGAAYQQLYQTNADVLASGRSELIRTDLFGLNGNVETQLGSKMSVKVGSDLSDTRYKTGGFIGNRYTNFPLNVYYKITPKLDLSAGYTYGVQQPTGGGASSQDNYFNLGARGDFTAKLTGSFSVGYETRRVAANPAQHLLAFNGTFNYELTPKTGAKVTITRNFSASSLGASTKNGAYRLGLNTEISPQWQLGADLAYLDNDYGAAVFLSGNTPVPALRTDHAWEASVVATYLYSQWLSTTATYTLHNNRSTIPQVDYSSNILSLMVGLRY